MSVPPSDPIDGESRLRIAMEAADLGIWDWNPITNEMLWSAHAKAIAGFPLDAPVSFEQVRNATHPDDLPRTSAMVRRALDPNIRSKEPYEYRLVRSDGSVRWVIANGEAIFANVNGVERAVRYIGTIQDISARKQAETDLREYASKLRLAIDAARLAVWEYNSSDVTIEHSPELNRLLGFPEDAKPSVAEIEARYYPGEQQRVRTAGVAALAAGERYFQAEYRYYGPDQSIRWHLMRAEIMFADDGKTVTGALGVLIDVTERKEAEEHRQVLVNELQHRVNNTLAVVGAMVRQSFHGAEDRESVGAALATFTARLSALGEAHNILTEEEWRSADLRDVVEAALKPYRTDNDRFNISGPPLELSSRRTVAMALALNELATNATKYGALRNPEGMVDILWSAEGVVPVLHFTWRESGGPKVSDPVRNGFGSVLIQEKLATDFEGEVRLEFLPEGLVCLLSAPISPERVPHGRIGP